MVLGAWGPCCSGEPGGLGPSRPGWWRSQNRRNEGWKESFCRPLLLLPSIFPSIRVLYEEIPLVQSKEQWLRFAGAAVENKCKKAKWLSEEALQIAVKRREAKGTQNT